ncbi:MAG: phage holin family protein [Candidatus Dormibacteria bacterium]
MASQDPVSAVPAPSLVDLLREILADALRTGRAELNLVKAEGVAAGKRGAIAVGLLAGAALAVFLVIVLLLGAAAEALGGLLGHRWLGWLIIAGLSLVVAATLAWLGYRMVRRTIAEGRRVGATVKEDLEWLRELPRQSASGS